MIENINSYKKFEQIEHHEVEQKFLPVFPEDLAEMRKQARPIEQFYLSHPSEPFNLRMRETLGDDGNFTYTATLKDRGLSTDHGIDRLEVEIPITPELYYYYNNPEQPLLRKLRAEPMPNVCIDFYDDNRVQVESENPDSWRQFTAKFGNAFVEVTGAYNADNEWRAHSRYRQEHAGKEALVPRRELSANTIAKEILHPNRERPTIIALQGRSGSGKSTIVRELQKRLHQHTLHSEVISTDDYHRGSSWLREHNDGKEWTLWDEPIVYDTKAMESDLHRLILGETIPRRTMDFGTGEPLINGEIKPAPVIILEGVYVGSHDLDSLGAERIHVPTPLATCIGRRLLRDMRERPQFADPAKSLKYMLEQAEPAWRAQNA